MVATGKFVLRSEGDTANPYATRLYGKGVTQGRTVFYLNNASGNRTAFLAILAQGARAVGDLPCDKVHRVYYAGFELPEFNETGGRNWKFHNGYVPTPPVYKGGYSVDTSTNEFVLASHGYTTGQIIGFWGRGADVIMPAVASGALEFNVKYTVTVTSSSRFTVTNPATGLAFDLTGSGSNLTRLFSYLDGTFLFDTNQGRPEFFPGLDFQFAGLAYLEILLPEHLSTGEDEPSNLKVIMQGKRMYDLMDSGGTLAFNTGVITAEPNNALVAADAIINDGKRPLSRLGSSTWRAWRDRCDASINWSGGNDSPTARSSWTTSSGVSYSSTSNVLTKTAGGGSYNCGAWTQAFTNVYASIEARYTGTPFRIAFSGGADNNASTKQGAVIEGGYLKYHYLGTTYEIIAVGIGDKIKITYENGVFTIYRNGVPMPMVVNTYLQQYTTYYIGIELFDNGGTADQIFIAPAGDTGTPRTTKRFQGGFVAPQPISVNDLFETEIHLSAASWADIGGKIEIATEPDRTPCFTFLHNPGGGVASNVAKVTVKRKSPDDVYNFWTYSYRDDDDPILKVNYTNIDRPARRSAVGGRLNSAPHQQYGVLNQSQIERIGESRARVETDLDTGFTVEAFLDSLVVCKGSFVHLVAPEAGYPVGAPALCQVIDERLATQDVETRIYELQICTVDFYSDTAHGAVTPVYASDTTALYIPPPPVQTIALTETIEPLPGGSIVSSVSGVVTFGVATAQRGRIFSKSLTSRLAAVTLVNGTDIFTITDTDTVPSGSTPLSLGSITNNPPTGIQVDAPYYVVNVSGLTFKLSRTIGGAAENFTSNGGGLNIYNYAEWIDTKIDLLPDASNETSFEIFPAYAGLTQIRVVTFSGADVTLPFHLHKYSSVEIVGDVTPPNPPSRLRCEFDGVLLNWSFQPSLSDNVESYYVTDENGVVIEQFLQGLRWTETARTLLTTRKVYAVTRLGIKSLTALTLDFVLPPSLAWVDPQGGEIVESSVFQKTAADGWNAGASFSWSILTPAIPAYFTTPVLTETNTMRCFGLTRDGGRGTPYITNYNQFYYGLKFNADATVEAVWQNPTVQTASIGTYAVGDQFVIKFTPSGSTWTPTVWRIRQVGEVYTETLVYTFSTLLNVYLPMWASVAVYTSGARVSPLLNISGDLIPTDSTPLTWQNLVEASGAPDSFTVVGGTVTLPSGWTTDKISARRDGIFEFDFNAAFANAYVGLCTANPNGLVANLGISVRMVNFSDAYVYVNGVFWIDFPVSGGTPRISISRENGSIVIRNQGKYITAISGGSIPAGYGQSNDIYLGVVVNQTGQNGKSVLNMTHRQARSSLTKSGVLVPVTSAGAAAQVGDQEVFNVPIFKVASPVAGQLAVFDKVGGIVNTTPGYTAFGINPIATGGTNASSFANTNGLVFYDGTRLVTDASLIYDATNNRLTIENMVIATPGSNNMVINSAIPTLSGTGGNTVFGSGAGVSLTTADNSVIIGRSAGAALTSQSKATLIGFEAGAALTNTGVGNVAVGAYALRSTTTPSYSTAVGYEALYTNAANYNLGIGYRAGYGINSGTNNTIIGSDSAAVSLTSGNYNVAVGSTAGSNLTTGSNNVAIGVATPFTSGTGSDQTNINNTFHATANESWVSRRTFSIIRSVSEIFEIVVSSVGVATITAYGSGTYITTPNIFSIGASAGVAARFNVRSTAEIARFEYDASNYLKLQIGSAGQATFTPTGATPTLSIGTDFTFNTSTKHLSVDSFRIATPGLNNFFITSTIPTVSGNGGNVLFGSQAGVSLTSGEANVIVGRRAGLVLTTQSYATLVGFEAGMGVTSTGVGNTAVGALALKGITTQSYNTAVGYEALLASAANYNLGIGYRAAYIVSSGTNNTIVGSDSAAASLSSGSYNVAIGSTAGSNLSTGSNNVAIGAATAFTSGSSSNQTNINNTFQATATESWVNRRTFSIIRSVSEILDIAVSSVGLTTLTAYGSGAGINSPNVLSLGASAGTSAQLTVRHTSSIARFEYDGSNYGSHVVSSSGVYTINAVGSGAKIVLGTVTELGYNTILRLGSLETNGFAVNNGWYGDNVYWDGANFRARVTGYGSMLYFLSGSIVFRQGNSVSAGSVLTLIDRWSINTSGQIIVNSAGTSAQLNVRSTGTQLALEYDGSNYLQVAVSSSGTVTFTAGGPTPRIAFAGAVKRGGVTLINDNYTLIVGNLALPFHKVEMTTTGKSVTVPVSSTTGLEVITTFWELVNISTTYTFSILPSGSDAFYLWSDSANLAYPATGEISVAPGGRATIRYMGSHGGYNKFHVSGHGLAEA